MNFSGSYQHSLQQKSGKIDALIKTDGLTFAMQIFLWK